MKTTFIIEIMFELLIDIIDYCLIMDLTMKGSDSQTESVENKNAYERTNLRTRSVKREKQELLYHNL